VSLYRRGLILAAFGAGLMAAACGAGTTTSSGASAGGPSPPPNTGVALTTVRAPTCPVQHAGDACTAPISVDVTITRPDASVVATIRTNAAGSAIIALNPGTYTLTGASAGGSAQLPRAPAPLSVVVLSGSYTPAQLVYDTGIR
jgi:hypothetical protein